MTEAMHIETRLNREFDTTCQQILDIMMVKDIFEADKIRYNALYKIVSQALKVSKPTFQAHIQHLITRRFVKRQKEGKQTVYLYLNLDNMMIRNERIMKKELEEDRKQLQDLVGNPDFWRVKMPNILALYGYLCSLRRWKLILQYYFSPNRSKENLLALACQARFQELLEDAFILSMLKLGNELPSEYERKKHVSNVIELLDADIEKIKNNLKQAAEKLAEKQA